MRKLLIGMLVTSSFLGVAPLAHAVCGQTFADIADQDLFSVHGCDTEFIETTKEEASLRRSEWTGRGWESANSCNILFEFPKFWNAWYLVTYGISHIPEPVHCTPGQIICLDVRDRPWHDRYDYLSLIQADNLGDILIYHDDLRYLPSDNRSDNYAKHTTRDVNSHLGSTVDSAIGDVGGFFGVDMDEKILLGCDAFDHKPDSNPPALGATPGYRSGALVHESWHAWNYVWDKLDEPSGGKGHEVNGPKFCETNPCPFCTQIGCDHFRPHTHSAYQTGELWQSGQRNGAMPLLSTYQLHLEYSCDLSDNAEKWVPYSVREDAANSAGWLARNRFVEKVPYWCGSTRPLWGMRPEGKPEYCSDQNRTSCHGGCPSGQVCGNDGCCIRECPAGSTCRCPSGTACSANYTCVGANYSCDLASGCCYYNISN